MTYFNNLTNQKLEYLINPPQQQFISIEKLETLYSKTGVYHNMSVYPFIRTTSVKNTGHEILELPVDILDFQSGYIPLVTYTKFEGHDDAGGVTYTLGNLTIQNQPLLTSIFGEDKVNDINLNNLESLLTRPINNILVQHNINDGNTPLTRGNNGKTEHEIVGLCIFNSNTRMIFDSYLGYEGMTIDGGYYEIPNTNKITNQFSIILNEIERLDEYGNYVEPMVYDCEIVVTYPSLYMVKPTLDQVLVDNYSTMVHKLVRFDDNPIPIFSNNDTIYASTQNTGNYSNIDNANQLLQCVLDIPTYQLLDVYEYCNAISNKVDIVIDGDNLNNSRITKVEYSYLINNPLNIYNMNMSNNNNNMVNRNYWYMYNQPYINVTLKQQANIAFERYNLHTLNTFDDVTGNFTNYYMFNPAYMNPYNYNSNNGMGIRFENKASGTQAPIFCNLNHIFTKIEKQDNVVTFEVIIYFDITEEFRTQILSLGERYRDCFIQGLYSYIMQFHYYDTIKKNTITQMIPIDISNTPNGDANWEYMTTAGINKKITYQIQSVRTKR